MGKAIPESDEGIDTLDASAPPAGRRSRGGLRRVVFGCLFAAGLFVGGFAWFANHVSALHTPSQPPEADAIIVLTGGHFRIDAAVDLLKSGKGRRLLISGVNPATRPIDLQSATGADERLFTCCVDIDRAALDTVGNAKESAKWVNRHAFRRIILVTNNYHMPRSLLEMRRLVGDASLLPYPVVNAELNIADWLSRPAAVRVLFTEYTKFLAALARGPFVPRQQSGEAMTARSH